ATQHVLMLLDWEVAMEGNARTWFTPKQRAELWERWKSGQCVADIARALERRNKSGVYLPCRSGHASIARDDLSQSLYSDTRCAEKGADGTPAHGAADAPSQGWHDEERTGTDRRCGFHPRTAGRGR